MIIFLLLWGVNIRVIDNFNITVQESVQALAHVMRGWTLITHDIFEFETSGKYNQ